MSEKEKEGNESSEKQDDLTKKNDGIDRQPSGETSFLRKFLKVDETLGEKDNWWQKMRTHYTMENEYMKNFLTPKSDIEKYLERSYYGFSHSNEQVLTLQNEINSLKQELAKIAKEGEKEKSDIKKIEEEFKTKAKKLLEKEKINHIIPRIHPDAQTLLFDSEDFKSLFSDKNETNAIVISIDIRKSTDLMLKARKPELFAEFITTLTRKLEATIIHNYGVFDKFTGDGILAFFPDFYSGKDAMYFALKAANECHEIFEDHYKKHRKCFNVVTNKAGLGIGIDYGRVTLVNTKSELTIVGIPVVYACRMAGAPAGTTLLNQPAYELAKESYSHDCHTEESSIEIKNEDSSIAYKVFIDKENVKIKAPNWVELIEQFKR